MRWITDEQSMALFFELTDKQYERIMTDKSWITDVDFVLECERSKGDNAHFFKFYGQGSIKIILDNIRWLLEDYKTVSWWNKKMTRFYGQRREKQWQS